MKNEKFYVGFDIGTDSVGYAVTDESYNLCKFRGEPMWGVTLFDMAEQSADRRSYRTARRRLDRRQQRVKLIMELFAKEISKIDEGFFKRIKESYLYPESAENKVRLFGSYGEQKDYTEKYPTIHHLIDELMESAEPHDVRLVYIACAWLVAHRGHFLSEVDKKKVDEVTDFRFVYQKLVDFIKHDDYSLPWDENNGLVEFERILKTKQPISKKSKALIEALFGKKAPKEVNAEFEYNYELVIKLLCGSSVKLKELFDKDEYEDLEEKSVALNMDDEKLATIMQSIGDDSELIMVLKGIYDWSVLVDVLKGKDTLSKAKIAVYQQHQSDLKLLKRLIKKYAGEKYYNVFRSAEVKNNYVSYVGKNKTSGESVKIKKSNSKEDFCKYIKSVLKGITPDACDLDEYNQALERLELGDFLPKQVDGDNRVIPYQLYWYELNSVLENAKNYLPFLSEADEDGITGADKILSVFEFRVPYYVGPLKENPERNRKLNYWMVRKAENGIKNTERIYPWNFSKVVDLDESETEFISRMTNSCTYVPGEDVLPKNSLLYSAFEVLNEINNIKINGEPISVSTKQGIYQNVFMKYDKVTPKRIKDYLTSIGELKKDDMFTGLDITVKSSLRSFRAFSNLVLGGMLSYADVERIINRATYSEDKARFRKWLVAEYSQLPESEIKYIAGLRFKEFGRLSRKFLCGVEGAVNYSTGEYMSVIRAMWETNNNLMQLLSDKFDFSRNIKAITEEYYGVNKKSLSQRLDEMYVSNAVKRPIIRTFDILKDIVKVQGRAPEMIFIEMARGTTADQKSNRTKTRLEQIKELYEKVKNEDCRRLLEILDSWGDSAHNKLQSDKLFLYFIQLGKCLYTGKEISLESVLSGDGVYNIEHIYPRSFVKDDSVLNNKILVDSKANGDKGDKYPIDGEIRERMRGYWTFLNKNGLIGEEKYKRLIRTTPFTDEEKYEFINRQLVETRQSTKAVALLINELYPDTQVIYVKAELASDFRKKFDLLKSRAVNDLHHAKDAYLNIVVGCVWHYKFSKRYYLKNADNNTKTEIVFTRTVKCGDRVVWNGAADKDRIVKIARKNNVHLTKYSFCRNGGFFDQMPLSAAEGLVPRKKNMPSEIYGGYNKTTASFFVLVRYKVAKKRDVMVMPVELLYADKFLSDEVFAKEYAKKTVENIVNKPVVDVEFLLDKRVIKINTMLSLDGFRVCITGKSGGGKQLGISVMEAFKTSPENEGYVKKLESFAEKRKKNPYIVCMEQFDGISREKNLALYDCYIEKLQQTQYKHRPANPLETLANGREKFMALAVEHQVPVLFAIHGLFGRAIKADLTAIGGVASAGVATLSSSLSNWKKNYTDVRIIDQSASGLFETVSQNLLDLL